MKIVHINYSDQTGGAAIAAYRHNEAMNKIGLKSRMLVVKRNLKSKSNIYKVLQNEKLLFILSNIFIRLNIFLNHYFKTFATFSFTFWGFKVHKHPIVKESDVIYLHWINNSMLSISSIEKILKLGKPVFWYMHDMYPFTGGCHYSFNCVKYQKECYNCPMLENKGSVDLVKKQFRMKMKKWSKYDNFYIVTPSKWLAKCAKESSIFKGHNVFVSPNVLDTNLFKPIDKEVAKSIMNVNLSKRVILFGADNINSPYKGWEYLCKTLNNLDTAKYECLVFGDYNESIVKQLKMSVSFTGYLHDQYSLILAYNAADVFVSPSIADNFPNVILEAMACGVPCVGFNIGGIPDLIHHKENGYLANYKDATDLENGINWIFNCNYNNLSQSARLSIIDNYSYEKVMKIHKELELCK